MDAIPTLAFLVLLFVFYVVNSRPNVKFNGKKRVTSCSNT
jgi:hypothetical protein